MAKLAGGVAVIRVGAVSEAEMKEKKARVEDALHATRAAVEEGVVAGGGVALLRSQAALSRSETTGDEAIGVQIVHTALESPLRQLVDNAGMEGALASVLGGLVSCPVIAVPTSVGYGASFHGLSALLTMLNSCASGITVVNIDNGFSAAVTATLINRKIDAGI